MTDSDYEQLCKQIRWSIYGAMLGIVALIFFALKTGPLAGFMLGWLFAWMSSDYSDYNFYDDYEDPEEHQ